MGNPVKFWGTSKVKVPVGKWVMITATFSQLSRKLYINGKLAARDAAGPTIALTKDSKDSPLLIGREFLGSYQNGRPLKYVRLAKVAVWAKQLTAANVRKLFESKTNHKVQPKSLVGAWDSVRDVESSVDGANFVKTRPLASSEDFPFPQVL